MQSQGESLDLLYPTHFPNSVVIDSVAVSAAARRAKRLDWRVAAKIFTYGRVLWAIDSFNPYKSPAKDGIFPTLLQEERKVLIPYLDKIFRACLANGYVPAIWRQVKVVFIPKPGKNSYGGPNDFRPISHISFLRPWRGC